MSKLYELTKEYKSILNEEMDIEKRNDLLDCIDGAIEEKAVNIIKVSKELEANTKAIDDEIKRLQDKKKAIVNNVTSLKEYLRYNMETTGINKIEHPLFKITLGKPVQKVNIIDVDLLDDEFVSVKTEIKPDLSKIKSALKNGAIDGAELVDGKSRLLIK